MNVLQLVYSESVIVQSIDLELDSLLKNKEKSKHLIWIYGYIDRYTPLHFPEELKRDYPDSKSR
jgi:hypothetical protein